MSLVIPLHEPHGLDPQTLRARVGGKAASLATMAHELGLPVPPAFAITTDACRRYFATGWPDALDGELRAAMTRLEAVAGRRFGDPGDPLLVSVRSGAPVSMPGMMDTILNLGLNDETEQALARVSGDPAFAAACRERFERTYREVVGTEAVPSDPWAQLRGATEAVFRSWHGERAVAYRRREGISDDLGTAVTVQAMVYGNRGADSATGVLFTRDPATGQATPYGDVLFEAQGEDVVAGTHRTEPIGALDTRLPAVAAELREHAGRLEHHFVDCVDIEFTIESGRLWMLQARVGKRSPQAALRMAVEMAEDPAFPLTRAEAVTRVAALLADPPRSAGQVHDRPAVTRGLAASPGIASGELVTSCERAIELADAGRRVILVRPSTAPDDVPAMARSAGILTSSGGPASHAAVVARGWGIPAVVGAAAVVVEDDRIRLGEAEVRDGDVVTIDGSTGDVFLGAVDHVGDVVPEAATLLEWAAEAGIRVGEAPETDATDVDEPRAATDPAARDAGAILPEVDRGLVLRTLAIKGYATEEGVAEALLADVEGVRPVLEGLVAEGTAEHAAGAYRLTAAGKATAASAIEADGAHMGPAEVDAALDAFLALDHRMKQAVTAWQMRTVDGQEVLNDHADSAHDRAVLDRLRSLHADTVAWLTPLVGRLARLERYRLRLDRALAAIDGGDQRFVASPRVDSLHGLWFELHEDLIRLAGRRREDEVAAGRA
jgi:pyruvate,orthophosphate dikinase